MRIYPTKRINNEIEVDDKPLTTSEKVTRVIALIIAFVTVYFFFFKILLF